MEVHKRAPLVISAPWVIGIPIISVIRQIRTGGGTLMGRGSNAAAAGPDLSEHSSRRRETRGLRRTTTAFETKFKRSLCRLPPKPVIGLDRPRERARAAAVAGPLQKGAGQSEQFSQMQVKGYSISIYI